MITLKKFLTVALMFVCTICAGCGEKITYKSISAVEGQKILAENPNVILVDVRTPQEFKGKHIANSILVPLEDLRNGDFAKIPNKDATFIVYCWSGPRSKDAAEILINKGYKHVYEMAGITEWTGSLEGTRVNAND